jgi:hypothetical protein
MSASLMGKPYEVDLDVPCGEPNHPFCPKCFCCICEGVTFVHSEAGGGAWGHACKECHEEWWTQEGHITHGRR